MVSTGKKERDAFLKNYLGPEFTDWSSHLDKIKDQKVVILGLPSDNGAGIIRGCAHGPMKIRQHMRKPAAFDIGDVFTVPHFLTDEMLSDEQIKKTRDVIYNIPGNTFPVSPLSICKRVYDLLYKINPKLKILLLGGDHSVTWPAMDSLLDSHGTKDFGVVHFDAHTDLLESRLGVDICFGTWTHHANIKLGRGNKIFQLGIRASGKPKEFWEKEHEVRQVWGHELQNITPTDLAKMVTDHFDSLGIKKVYITNDIDGTDAKWAAACGTPEPGGMTPDQVIAVIKAMKKYEVIGADVVEVAPDLSLDPELSKKTLETSQLYIETSLEVL